MSKKEHKIQVLVIGGGASGMMAAGRAAELGKDVVLLEKNKFLGEKLKITGGGRCNITNEEYDMKKLLSFYGDAEKFLYSSFSRFGVKETFNFFESKSLPLIVQNNNRAFPKTEKALDVFLVLEKYLKDNKVNIQTRSAVKKIIYQNGIITKVETENGIFYPEKVIMATGGVSHPETGSTGDGFNWLEESGHEVRKPTPDIVPLSLKEKWIKKLSGISLNDVKITFYCNGEKKFMKKGRILCTHFGISGPTVLNSSSKVKDLLHEGLVTGRIDLFPTLNSGELSKKIVELFDENKNKMLKNILPKILPQGFVTVLADIFPEIDLSTKVHSIKKEERKKIVYTLKDIEVTVNGLMGLNRAVASDGGVVLSEVDTRTMQSKKCSNLYITGDLLHIRRPSGGYSLQLCWTTGFIAGSSV